MSLSITLDSAALEMCNGLDPTFYMCVKCNTSLQRHLKKGLQLLQQLLVSFNLLLQGFDPDEQGGKLHLNVFY